MMRLWAVAWWDFIASPWDMPEGGVVVPGVDEGQARENARPFLPGPLHIVKVKEVAA